MSRLPIVFHSFAEADVEDARQWYECRRTNLGFEFASEIVALVERVAERPTMYEALQGQVRAASLKRFPYRVVYEVFDDRVEILGVIHQSRDLEAWWERIRN